jgi:phytol kinase
MAVPWLGLVLVPVTLVGLLGGLRLCQRWAHLHPELVRKLLHLGMGLVTLSFPWLFDSAWPVFVLAALSIGLLVLLRTVRSLKESVGSVVGGVARVSLGEIYFPLSVSLLFFLYTRATDTPPAQRVLLYCVPLLLLALADAAAALVGVRYGHAKYHTADGFKSVEGSLAFFVCAVGLAAGPLLLGGDVGWERALLIALLMAWLTTIVEAIAWGGLDNLVLPLVGFLLLKIYLEQSVEQLLLRLLVTGLLLAVLVVYRGYTTLLGSAKLGAFLTGYVCWALGGWHWLLAPLILFLTYSLLSRRTPPSERRVHTVHGVVCVASAGMLWLSLNRILGRPELLYPFTLAFAAHLAMISIASFKYDYPRLSGGAVLALGLGVSWPLLFVPYLLVEGLTGDRIRCALVALPAMAAAAVAFYWTQPHIENCPIDTARWLRQGAWAGLASAVGLGPLYLTWSL